jgi:hypothetical protein
MYLGEELGSLSFWFGYPPMDFHYGKRDGYTLPLRVLKTPFRSLNQRFLDFFRNLPFFA